jgi:hypothetical protein
VGLKEEELEQRANLWMLGIGSQFLASFRPNFMGRKVAYSIGHLFSLFSPIVMRAIKVIIKTRKKKKQAKVEKGSESNKRKSSRMPLKGFNPLRDREQTISFFNKPVIAKGESSSFNANCSARGLAKVASMMAAGGKLEGKEFFSQTAWQALHDKALTAKLGGNVTTHFTQGGLNYFSMVNSQNTASDRALNEGREGFYGWMGLGGSIFQWHPEKEIGFAFVPTSMHVIDLFNERGKVYQEEIFRCIK